MDTEIVLGQIVPHVSTLLAVLVAQLAGDDRPTLYTLEAQTQSVLPQIGQVVLQALVSAQGSGLEGPTQACACGGSLVYHGRCRPLQVTSSLGQIRIAQRAHYHCAACGAHERPLDAQLGHAGCMRRYLQEQCGWLLALLPARLA
jgi:hypothetical protein